MFADVDPAKFPPDQQYPGLRTGSFGPSRSALRAAAESPIALFFYFLPTRLWEKIRVESNRYHSEQISPRTDKTREKQKTNKVPHPEKKADIRARLRSEEAFETYEFPRLVGLLIARALCPHKQRIAKHWAMSGEGAVPAGTFGKYMARNRFDQIMKSLHFTSNDDVKAKTD